MIVQKSRVITRRKIFFRRIFQIVEIIFRRFFIFVVVFRDRIKSMFEQPGEEDFQTICEVVEKMVEQSADLITTRKQGM